MESVKSCNILVSSLSLVLVSVSFLLYPSMESPNRSHVSSLKRNLTECCGVTTCKVARVDMDHGPSFRRCSHGCHCCPMRPTVADSCFNYLNSSSPRRIMFYNRGEWLDFSGATLQTLIKGFKDEKSSIAFSAGGQPLLLDFLSMILINLRARKQRSVAWIDDADKCFFPTFFIDEEADESAEWVFEFTGSKPHGPQVARACGSPPEVVKCVVVESGGLVPPRLSSPAKVLCTKIDKLEKDSDDFLFVQKLFLKGMGPFATPLNMLHVHKCVQKDNNARARLDTFESQINLMKAKRDGNADVQYGWFGSKKTDIVGILIDGFGMAGKPTEGAAFGTGIYLTPDSRAFASVNLCDVDEKGVQCMMLCRIILGNTEQVQPGSKQYLPSSQDFDSGVDNFLSPKCYVVWPAHANSYIHPEYVVSFMLAPDVREYLFGLKDVRFHVPLPRVVQDVSARRPVRCEPVKGPISPWMSFTTLFEEIQDSISPLAKELLFHHHEELKLKIITREELIKKMRLIVGDQLLVSTLKRLQRSPASWYDASGARITNLDVSSAQKTEIDGSASPRMDPNGSAASKMVLNGSAALKSNESVAPIIDLNHSASPKNELDDSVTTTMELNDSDTVSSKPYGSAMRTNDPSGATS